MNLPNSNNGSDFLLPFQTIQLASTVTGTEDEEKPKTNPESALTDEVMDALLSALLG